MAACLSRTAWMPLDCRACLRDSQHAYDALPRVLAFRRGPSGTSAADSVGAYFQKRFLSAEPSESQQQNQEFLPPSQLSCSTGASNEDVQISRTTRVCRLKTSASCTDSVREVPTTSAGKSQEGGQGDGQNNRMFEINEEDGGARGEPLVVDNTDVLKVPVTDAGAAALPSIRWNPWSASPGRRRRVVKTESNVRRMRRKRPQPECSICEGSGKVGAAVGMDLQISSETRHLTVDGDIGMEEQEGRKLSRKMFIGGFFALPWLWFVNCYYFWPVLRYGGDSVIRKNTIQSLVGFILFTALLLPWTFTFAIGGEKLIGPSWKKLAVYVIMPENLS